MAAWQPQVRTAQRRTTQRRTAQRTPQRTTEGNGGWGERRRRRWEGRREEGLAEAVKHSPSVWLPLAAWRPQVRPAKDAVEVGGEDRQRGLGGGRKRGGKGVYMQVAGQRAALPGTCKALYRANRTPKVIFGVVAAAGTEAPAGDAPAVPKNKKYRKDKRTWATRCIARPAAARKADRRGARLSASSALWPQLGTRTTLTNGSP